MAEEFRHLLLALHAGTNGEACGEALLWHNTALDWTTSPWLSCHCPRELHCNGYQACGADARTAGKTRIGGGTEAGEEKGLPRGGGGNGRRGAQAHRYNNLRRRTRAQGGARARASSPRAPKKEGRPEVWAAASPTRSKSGLLRGWPAVRDAMGPRGGGGADPRAQATAGGPLRAPTKGHSSERSLLCTADCWRGARDMRQMAWEISKSSPPGHIHYHHQTSQRLILEAGRRSWLRLAASQRGQRPILRHVPVS
ncbi:unnamed protein product [Prorocentrum cordatum]|uniref:Uncharacterized protein n=1 Tax=Prorocentrum cordatum TaxID=2364126 RepID=A0ABN9WN44_9DINO|nr:unnamed protein product [Polarella glacialis]